MGNSAYKNVAELANPKHDAAAMTEKLTSLGFEVVTGTDLDLIEMKKTVRRFIRELSGSDIAVFYYAGHGLQVNGSNYMAPIDANLRSYDDLDFETVPMNLVLSAMERNAKVNMIFLDACRDNPLAVNLARSMGTRSAAVGRGLAQVGSGVGTLVSFSTQPGNVALDGTGQNSPYTSALVKHLGTPGEDIAQSMVSVRREVLKLTNGKQVPWEHSSLTGKVVLKNKPDVASVPQPTLEPSVGAKPIQDNISNKIELVFWDSIKNETEPELLQTYLMKYPNGVFASLASARLKLVLRKQKEAAAPKQPDATIELAYWDAIKDSERAQFFEAYLNRYPNGLYSEIAKLKIELSKERQGTKFEKILVSKPRAVAPAPENGPDKIALLEPEVATIVESDKPAFDVKEITRGVQRELNRLGCNAGPNDGIWGKGSRKALGQYGNHAQNKLVSLEPSPELLEQLRTNKSRVCPIICRRGFKKQDDQCIRTRREANVQKREPPRQIKQPSAAKTIRKRRVERTAPPPRRRARRSDGKSSYRCMGMGGKGRIHRWNPVEYAQRDFTDQIIGRCTKL
ncbi:MAG: caspase family protein [Rhizobiaceae bacterium]|nr:caspase family protein [Rhizobiaceae bacterium]